MQMKDGLSKAAVLRISAALALLLRQFDAEKFESEAMDEIKGLELKGRVNALIRVLHRYFPQKFSDAAVVLTKLPDVWDRGDPDDPLKGFAAWPLIDYVGVYGLDSPKLALRVLEKLTPLFSSEFAIRPFIERHPEIVFKQLDRWVTHKDEHVRRLVSEGTRPRLPWGIQLKVFVQDPKPCIPLLASLRLDGSEYVRRSVANHLNDIGKDHPKLLVELCAQWQEEDKGSSDWVISHATRSLVKAGHPEVFPLLGYTPAPKVEIGSLELNQKVVRLGESLPFCFSIKSLKDQRFVLDYVVYYMKASGELAPKVYKLKNLSLQRGDTLSLEKVISFKPISTRKFYVGQHQLAIQVNGVECAWMEFDVV